MVGYERYEKMTSEQYDKRTFMFYLCRTPADRNLIPAICSIENKKILDVGLGSGSYTRYLIEKNDVTGIDQNPHLCKLPIKVHKGDATELSKLTGKEKFDIVLSTWMTDYLNEENLTKFFAEAKAVLNNDGKLMTTIPNTYGFGLIYITAAKIIRDVNKYTYTKKKVTKILNILGFKDVKFVNLNSWIFPWAYLVIAEV